MNLDLINGFCLPLLAGLSVVLITYMVGYCKKKIEKKKEEEANRVSFNVTISLGQFKSIMTLTNTSRISIYNLQVEPPSNLFWDFEYTPVKELEPNESVDMTFSKVLAPQKDWYLMLKWTDEDGKNKQKRKIELKF